MFTPIWMAAQAVRNIPNAFFVVMLDGLILVMAGVAGPVAEAIRVTGRTTIGISMSHRETVRSIVTGRFPGIGRMAARTIRSKLTTVLIPVAGCTG